MIIELGFYIALSCILQNLVEFYYHSRLQGYDVGVMWFFLEKIIQILWQY